MVQCEKKLRKQIEMEFPGCEKKLRKQNRDEVYGMC